MDSTVVIYIPERNTKLTWTIKNQSDGLFLSLHKGFFIHSVQDVLVSTF